MKVMFTYTSGMELKIKSQMELITELEDKIKCCDEEIKKVKSIMINTFHNALMYFSWIICSLAQRLN
jgi:hypothetical protein